MMQALKFGMTAPTVCGMKHPDHLDLEASRWMLVCVWTQQKELSCV